MQYYFLTLNISVAIACIFLWWIETEFYFFNRSWNEDDLSPYVILNALSCKEFVLLLRPLLWNIQTKGQYPNWDATNPFITVSLFFKTHLWSNSCWCDEFLTCFFTAVVYVIFKTKFWIQNPKLYLAVHSYFQILWYYHWY